MNNTIDIFLVILAASFVFTTLLSKIPLLRIPSAVGYLLFGVLLHMGVIQMGDEEMRWITQLGDFGLLFLMFLSGLEVDITLLRPQAWRDTSFNPLTLATTAFLATLLFSYVISLCITGLIPGHINPWMLTLLLSTTSLGIILPILEETDILHTEFGQVLLIYALIADLCTMLLISLFISASTSGRLSDFMLGLILIPVVVLAYPVILLMKKSRRARNLAGDVQNRMRAMIALMAAFCAIADFSGSEPILGSFLVGILVSAIPFAFKKRLRDYTHGIGYGFLIPIFFISVGLNFNLSILKESSSMLWVPLLLGAAFLVKVGPAWLFRKHFGRRGALAGGFLMSARLGLIVAAADIGVRIGALPQFLSEAIVIVAVITCLAAPIIFVYLYRVAT
ncbi:cation:proton antiporter [Alicyclobacillus curvatus]|jgi:Kef-type K+ transport system membrane component KefB|nr:cation:proton antiporter [Alicyclobacillus curvatus]